MTEEHKVKTVQVYYNNDIIGNAEIETIKNKYIDQVQRTTNIWVVNYIRIYIRAKCLFNYVIDERHCKLYSVINSETFEGVAVTLGFPNHKLEIGVNNKIFPFDVGDTYISFEDCKPY